MYFADSNYSYCNMTGGGTDFVFNYYLLWGQQNETIFKERWVASAAASETFGFKNPTGWRIIVREGMA